MPQNLVSWMYKIEGICGDCRQPVRQLYVTQWDFRGAGTTDLLAIELPLAVFIPVECPTTKEDHDFGYKG